MDIQFYGANCVRLSNKRASVVIDDNLADLGQPSITKTGEIAIFTGAHGEPAVETKLLMDYPGEYEVSDVSIQGIAARGHMDQEGKNNSVIYRLVMDDVRVVALGHVYPELNEAQLEAIGTVDVLIVPVGGNGYTLDPIGALKLIKKIEPKLVIPTHYADSELNFAVPQQELEDALKNMAMETRETVAKLKIKAGDLDDVTQLVVLERQ